MGPPLPVDGDLSRQEELQILLLVLTPHFLVLVLLVFIMSFVHLFLVVDDRQSEQNEDTTTAWRMALKYNAFSFVLAV